MASKGIRTISFVSLGCPKNLVDSEKMLGLLAESGLTPVSSQQEDFGGADAVVVNTCGFLEASKEESLGVIKEAIAAKEAGNVKRVIVAGCLVQRHRAKMLEWAPGIDAMVGVFDRDKIVDAVMGGADGEAKTRALNARKAPKAADSPKYWISGNALVAADERGLKTTGLTVNGKDGKGIGYFEDDSSRLRLTPRHYAYLRISEGCNQNCAFCTIPSIRGKMRSKGPDAILQEARELLLDGAHELLLIGQDTTSYGDDIGLGLGGPSLRGGRDLFASGLPRILKQLSDTVRDTSGQGWLRLMYAYPTNFSDDIIDAMADLCASGHLIPYLDIPLQHASDNMLKAMRRNVTRKQQEQLITKLKKKIPGFAVRTTFISGFPGETSDDHKQLVEFVSEMDFENVGVFEYSHEEGTVAGTMEKDPSLAVPAEVKAHRRNEVMEAQQRNVFARNEALAAKFDEKHPLDKQAKAKGHIVDVIIDAPLRTSGKKTTGVTDAGKLYQGRTKSQAPQIDGLTFVHSKDKLASGEVLRCVIVDWDGYDLVAKPVSELEKKVALKVLR
ncbi:MAG TPA: 30S ribosomal protein S12 methylthiotransferase RimO [Phycisphaerales bacterium]|nr:30S ribosomal protein S12 methylthiotransferase RimO [Phycisphaerales bacterium]